MGGLGVLSDFLEVNYYLPLQFTRKEGLMNLMTLSRLILAWIYGIRAENCVRLSKFMKMLLRLTALETYLTANLVIVNINN